MTEILTVDFHRINCPTVEDKQKRDKETENDQEQKRNIILTISSKRGGKGFRDKFTQTLCNALKKITVKKRGQN